MRLASSPLERETQGVGQTVFRMAVEAHIRQTVGQTRVQPVPHGHQVPAGMIETAIGHLAGLSQSHDRHDVFGAGSPAHLLTCSMAEFLEQQPFSHVKRPDSFGSIEFMPGHREHIYVHRLNIDGDFAEALGRIGVNAYLFLPRDPGDFIDRLNRSDLVVGMHDGNQDGVRPDGGGHIVQADHAGVIDIHIGGLETLLFQVSAHVQDCRVLHGAGDNVTAFSLKRSGHAFDGVVVGFGAAGGEEYLFRPAVEQTGHLPPGPLHRFFGANAVPVGTGRVAEIGLQERAHGRDHFRVVGRGAIIVQVDGLNHGPPSFFFR